MSYEVTFNADDMIQPALRRLRQSIHVKLDEMALRIVEEEIAKYAVELSRWVSIHNRGEVFEIHIRKDGLK